MFEKILFIFRRDLRVHDNTGLIFALKNARKVIPCFIFTPEQIDDNPLKSNRCVQFMLESLEDLEEELVAKKAKLFFFHGPVEKVIKNCIEDLKIQAVVVNRDYTPYSISRDAAILRICQNYEIPFFSCEDLLLHAPEVTLKADRTPYTIFTPFFRNAQKLHVRTPDTNTLNNYWTQSIPFALKKDFFKKILPKPYLQQKGGRQAALHLLKHLNDLENYPATKDHLALDGTSHLSAHLKFTTCSPREIYWAIVKKFGPHHELIRSLYWRDFFTQIAFFFPKVFEGAFHAKYNHLKWSDDHEAFQRWCLGETGIPIVDAGMREMNQTGFMHNRARMIVSSFLVKDLHVNWQWGERYFAQSLIDYDPAVNNGNWQWSASTGCDCQPYFRIFNPWKQAQKFDPECIYIKRWVPELSAFNPQVIHEWYLQKNYSLSSEYPPPMVEHTQESQRTLTQYRKVSSKI